MKEIEHFFAIYKDLEGKKIKIGGWRDGKTAIKVIKESQKMYRCSIK